MTIKAVLIPADEQQPMSVVTFNQDDLLRMQQYVGGYIEPIELGDNLSVFVAEEGKIRNYPHNARATVFIVLNRRKGQPVDHIAGDALVLGGVDSDGNTMSVPDEIVIRLCAASMP